MFLHNAGTQFLTLFKNTFCWKKSFYINFPSFTELHFLWHIRLGHQGIGEYNPSADLQTLCETQCSAIFITLYFTSPSSFLAITARSKDQRTNLEFGHEGQRSNYTVIAVLLLKLFFRMVNDIKRGSSFTGSLVMQKTKSVNNILKTKEYSHICSYTVCRCRQSIDFIFVQFTVDTVLFLWSSSQMILL